MMWSNVKVQYLSPVLLVPPNVSGIALELADDEEEEEEGIMASMSQKIGQVCWDVVHERLCRVLERAVKQSTRRASMNATVLDGSKWDLKPKSAKKKKKVSPQRPLFLTAFSGTRQVASRSSSSPGSVFLPPSKRVNSAIRIKLELMS